MTFTEFYNHLSENPKIKSYNSTRLASILGLDVETVVSYRLMMKSEKPVLNEVPTIEELEAVNYAVDNKYKMPQDIKGFSVSSFKIGKDGTPSETWYKTAEDSFEDTIDWNSLKKEITKNVKPVKFPSGKKNNLIKSHRIFWLSDIHVGMLTDNWGVSELKNAFLEVLNHLDGVDEVIIVSLGDGIDGLNAQTTRGGHRLPQNMSNQEQLLNLVDCYKILFDGLADAVNKGSIKTFKFASVYESNHSGDMDYVVAKFLEMWLDVKYPSVKTVIAKDMFGLLQVNEYNLYFTHGKDAHHQKYGFPMSLTDKIEIYLAHVLKTNFSCFDLNPKRNIVVSGDLHTESFSQGKFFKYYKVPAMAPSSAWVKANFGESIPAIQYFTITNKLEVGTIEL